MTQTLKVRLLQRWLSSESKINLEGELAFHCAAFSAQLTGQSCEEVVCEFSCERHIRTWAHSPLSAERSQSDPRAIPE